MAFNNEDFLHFTLGMSFLRIPSLSSKTMALFLSGKHFFQDFINLSLQKCLYDQAVMAFDQYLRKYGPNVSTNPIMITRIFPHWPMGFTL